MKLHPRWLLLPLSLFTMAAYDDGCGTRYVTDYRDNRNYNISHGLRNDGLYAVALAEGGKDVIVDIDTVKEASAIKESQGQQALAAHLKDLREASPYAAERVRQIVSPHTPPLLAKEECDVYEDMLLRMGSDVYDRVCELIRGARQRAAASGEKSALDYLRGASDGRLAERSPRPWEAEKVRQMLFPKSDPILTEAEFSLLSEAHRMPKNEWGTNRLLDMFNFVRERKTAGSKAEAISWLKEKSLWYPLESEKVRQVLFPSETPLVSKAEIDLLTEFPRDEDGTVAARVRRYYAEARRRKFYSGDYEALMFLERRAGPALDSGPWEAERVRQALLPNSSPVVSEARMKALEVAARDADMSRKPRQNPFSQSQGVPGLEPPVKPAVTGPAQATPGTTAKPPPKDEAATPSVRPEPRPEAPKPDAVPARRRAYAVIVGISQYAEKNETAGIPDLVFAHNDAEDFARSLKKLGWTSSEIKLLVNKQATKRNVEVALESWLTKAGPNDLIVLFWSGHGFHDPEDPEKVYFACHDTDMAIPATGYRMDKVCASLRERNTRNVIVFADTCHAGRLITRGEKAISIMPYVEKLRAEQQVPKGWIFMVGADTDRLAVEHSSWSNGAFTRCLVQGLSGAADGFESVGPKDGSITMLELRSYLDATMPAETERVLGAAKRPLITTTAGDPGIWMLSLEQHREEN